MKKIVLLFPNCNAARLLGIRLIETQNVVVSYCPTTEDCELAANINEEMSILSMEQCQKLGLGSGMGTSNARFVLQTGEDFRDCDVLVLPTLDVVRCRPDKEYSTMVEAHFKELKRRGLQIDPDTKIIFGSNHGGLIAGALWGKIWPEHRMQILVVSSIFEASVKVFGRDSQSRAMPLQRRGDVYFSDNTRQSNEHQTLTSMGQAYNLDDFSTLEAKLLHGLINLILEGDILDELELLGKFPNSEEAEKFGLKEGEINWCPTKDLPWFQDFTKNHPYTS